MKINTVLTDTLSFVYMCIYHWSIGSLACFLPAKMLSVINSRLHPWKSCGLKSVGLYLLFPAFQPRSEYSFRQVKAFACIILGHFNNQEFVRITLRA